MGNTKLTDALYNVGLPQYAQKVGTSLLDLNKKQIEDIKDTVETCDKVYKESFTKTETRKTLVSKIQEWCEVYRCSSLWID